MNIKSVVSLCALAALPAFATDVPTSNEFGTMKVTCNAAKVMICTPWVECVSGDAIKVTNLVMTAGLAQNDAVIVYDRANNNFKSWQLDANLVWQSVAVSQTGATVVTGDASNEAIARGNGFWFVKSNFGTGEGKVSSYDLYLYGQKAATAGASSTIYKGAYNLLANPNASAFNVAATGKIDGATEGDCIQLAGGVIYRYNGTSWMTKQKIELGTPGSGVYKIKDVTTNEVSIAGATGFWYKSAGSGDAGSISWQ